jgi:hypothetical protein
MFRRPVRRLVRGTLALAVATLAACTPDADPTAPVAERSLAPLPPSFAPMTLVVTSTADDLTEGTLRKAIQDAEPGSTITFDPALAGATIQLQPQPPLGSVLHIQKDLIVEGPQPGGITLRGGGIGVVINAHAPEGAVILRDLTITGGATASEGGGLRTHGLVQLERVRVTGNTAFLGGGIFVGGGTLRLVESIVTGNVAEQGEGGGVRAEEQTSLVEIIGSTISDNVADFGGGVYASGTVVIAGSTISGNVAAHSSGGVRSRVLVVDGSTISGNRAEGGSGGGLAGMFLTVRNSTISGNASSDVGGGIFASIELHATHVTIVGNTAIASGAGFFSNDADLFLANSLIAGNLRNGDPVNCGGPVGERTFAGRNLISDTSCGAEGEALVVDDPILGPLADNGGPTETHAILRGSPGIDWTDTCPLDVEQRGFARPAGAGCDAGAVEFDDYAAVGHAIDPSGVVNKNTGTAILSGSTTCEEPSTIELEVRVLQQQKARRLKTTVEGTTRVTVQCGPAGTLWAAAVTPLTGGFVNSPVEVTATTVLAPAWFASATATATGVVLAWSRK